MDETRLIGDHTPPGSRGSTGSEEREQQFLYSGYGKSATTPTTQSETLLQAYLRVVKRYKLLIFCTSIIVIFITVLATRAMPWVYSSTATVNVGGLSTPSESPIMKFLAAQTEEYSYMYSMLTLLTSSQIAKSVLTRHPEILEYLESSSVELKQTSADTKTKEMRLDDAIEQYLLHISWQQLDESTMIKITAKAKWPLMASTMANAHAESFIELVRAQRISAITTSLESLRQRVDDMKIKVTDSEKRLKDFTDENAQHIAQFEANPQGNSNRIARLVEQRSQARMQSAIVQSELRALGPSSSRKYNFNDRVREESLKIDELQRELENVRRQNRRNTAFAEKTIQREINRIQEGLRLSASQHFKQTKTKHEQSLAQERFLDSEISRLKNEDVDLAEKRVRYHNLKKDFEATRALYLQLASRFEDALIDAEGGKQNVVVVDAAVSPRAPSSPNPKFNFILGCVFGPLLGIALAFLFDFFDERIQCPQQLQSATNVTVIGLIPAFPHKFVRKAPKGSERSPPDRNTSPPSPHSRRAQHTTNDESAMILVDPYAMPPAPPLSPKRSHAERLSLLEELGEDIFLPVVQNKRTNKSRSKAKQAGPTCSLENPNEYQAAPEFSKQQADTIVDPSIVLISAPNSNQSEAFRDLRTIITHGCLDDSPQIILVSSGQAGDGKTTVATNLAISLAQTNERTLLMDADLRSPKVQEMFSLSRSTDGLAEAITQSADTNSTIVQTSIPNFFLQLAGSESENPADLIASREMVAVLDELSKQFDRIIIDSPPIGAVTDALLLSRNVDGVILVARNQKTPLPSIVSATQRLRQMEARVLGAVFNDVQRGERYYQQDYYYTVEEL